MHVTGLVSDLLPNLALIPAGEFVMGSTDGDEDERPAHRVHVDEFLMSVHPVTHADYARFVRATNYRTPDIHELPLVVIAGAAERERQFRDTASPYVWVNGQPPAERVLHPVTLIRWEDAVAYCEWLSAESGRTLRLPTEAEWEKAARGGLEASRYPWGDRLDRHFANFLADPVLRARHGTSASGKYPPNGYGLHDMAGNVWEWVYDWYDPQYYSSAPFDNPRGPSAGQLRVLRGGSWLSADVRMLSCSHRHKVPPDTYSYAIGFRIVCEV